MKRILVALVSGVIFGAGLAWSGMADPHRVRSFLDLFGDWDPTLGFVMIGAIIPMAFAWRVRQRMERPLADGSFDLPGATRIDARLAAGAVIFGIGWGIGGLCPGPGIAGLAIVPADAALFTSTMLAGMALHRYTSGPRWAKEKK
ncbi:MAG: YeeE/YedE family protein [Gammaproteobacteria bacterium]|nr:YeeE/YedE family protein [Gammaproteobacteria bacterium]